MDEDLQQTNNISTEKRENFVNFCVGGKSQVIAGSERSVVKFFKIFKGGEMKKSECKNKIYCQR